MAEVNAQVKRRRSSGEDCKQGRHSIPNSSTRGERDKERGRKSGRERKEKLRGWKKRWGAKTAGWWRRNWRSGRTKRRWRGDWRKIKIEGKRKVQDVNRGSHGGRLGSGAGH